MLKQTFRNLARVREIISILIKYGFEDIIVNSTLRNFISEKKRINWSRNEKPVFELTRWERIRMVVEELGPTFVKVAQILSNRPDLLPEPLIKEFEKLQDSVPPFSYEEVRRIIKEETGDELEVSFAEFNPKVLASASIGQVHRAKLHNGESVVVKIQRPEAKESIERDLTILADIVRRADRYLKKQGVLNAGDVVNVFERSMTRELDYTNEGRNIQKFRNIYANNTNLYIPKVYKHFTTTRMLTMEFCDGCKITNVDQLKEWKLSPEKMVEQGMGIYLEMIFENGSFHADPHPGNVLVNEKGKIVLLDFGMVGHLMRRDKYNFSMVFISISKQDARGAAESLRKLAVEENITDNRAFEYDMQELIMDFSNLDVSEASIADMIARLQKIMLQYQIKVPGDIYIIFRALAILEGIGKIMHPNFRTYDFIKPWGVKVLKDRLKPKNIYYDISSRVSNVSALFSSFPLEVKQIMQSIRKGKLRFEVEHQGYGYLLKKMDSLTNRISITLLIFALLISSSIMATVKFPNNLMTSFGLNYFSFAGLWIAGFLFIILAYSIIRRRKYK